MQLLLTATTIIVSRQHGFCVSYIIDILLSSDFTVRHSNLWIENGGIILQFPHIARITCGAFLRPRSNVVVKIVARFHYTGFTDVSATCAKLPWDKLETSRRSFWLVADLFKRETIVVGETVNSRRHCSSLQNFSETTPCLNL